jgi:predicted nucleic acid-binding Zn finger protein
MIDLNMNLDTCKSVIRSYFSNSPSIEIGKYLKVLENKWDKIQNVITGKRSLKYCFLPSGLYFWVIQGKMDEYLVLTPYYCSCSDFYFNAISKKKEPCCYHIIAQIICQNLNQFITIYKDDGVYMDYVVDFMDSERTG